MRLPWIVGLSLVVLSAAGCRSTKPLRSWKGDEALYGWAHDTLAAGADPEAVDSIVLARSDQRYPTLEDLEVGIGKRPPQVWELLWECGETERACGPGAELKGGFGWRLFAVFYQEWCEPLRQGH